jgi:hypothetical protein
LFTFRGLLNCLIFRQFSEVGQMQRKIWDQGKLSAELSTGMVDAFLLACALVPLQRSLKNHIYLS